MQLNHEQRGKYLLINAVGRLDATWSEHFADTLLTHIRHGHHHLIIDASGMSFLSSAGIRSLMQVHKELLAVQGAFLIIQATDFVANTLDTTGLHFWLAEGPPVDMLLADASPSTGISGVVETYAINLSASLTLTMPARWKPWQMVQPENVTTLKCTKDVFSLGIGSAASHLDEAMDRLGEFLTVAGNVVFQPPNESGRPDYLLAEKDYIPEMQAIQAIICTGTMSHLLRFSPDSDKAYHLLSEIIEIAMKQTRCSAIGFVILGEIEGLVGAAMSRSPGMLREDRNIVHPEILDWLSFCGERAHAGKQALLFGVATKSDQAKVTSLLSVMPSQPGIAAHVHACVFPYQPLQNGQIDLDVTLGKFFGGPPPEAIMHLADDVRPAIGLGQSSLIRGACWCSPITNLEDLL